ncbi:hypothetical protein P7C73_g2137, partial [Tremellales sp. Uapishka_1]
MPFFAAVGTRISQLLHSLVYSLPSPYNSTSNTTSDAKGYSTLSSLDDMGLEQGETKALAGGVGPLSFAGSGYGVMLVVMMALFLSVIIVFSLILKAILHIFTLGYLPSPVFVNLLPHGGASPSSEDDFGVALLKLGTSCIEATQFSGLRNELAGVQHKAGPWVEISTSGSSVVNSSSSGFHHLITRIDATELQDLNAESAYWNHYKAFWRACSTALLDIGWSVVLTIPGGYSLWNKGKTVYRGRWWYGPREWRVWERQAWSVPPASMEAIIPSSTEVPLGSSARQDPHASFTYDQVIRGEVTIDDDEEDWHDDGEDDSSGSGSGSEDEGQEISLYRGLVSPTETVDLQPVLLAHLTSHSSSPLTRRRFAAIMSPKREINRSLQEVVDQRRTVAPFAQRDEWEAERRRCCIVCTVEERDTILWPCRWV